MTLGTAAEEIARSDALWTATGFDALRTQQDTDYGHWGPHKFEMPTAEGKWDNVTTNSATVLANKIMGLLSSSWLQLFIEVEEEKKAGRKRISDTERLANGCIWMADRKAIAVPSGKRIQAVLSALAVLRGGTAKSVYWYNDEDKKPVCDIRKYDPMFCQWIEGEEELLWFCYRDYVTDAFLNHVYKKQLQEGFKVGNANKNKRFLLRTFWDDEQWRVALNGEYLDEGKHGLGYIPVNIRSCGAVPYLQSEEYQDTMKESWQSYAMNTRGLYDLESKLLSIEASKALESGKIKIVGEWNSQESNNEPPHGLEKLGYGSQTRNEIVLFDVAKGQRFGGMVQPPSNEVVDQFLNRIRTMDIIGSIDPIAFGQMTRSGSGALAAELRSAALEFLNPFRECVEEDFKWIAEECVRQFKSGQYEKVSLEGRDRKREKFHVDLEPSDVEERHFECNLVADRLRDEIQELGAAIQKVSYRLSSRRTAMLKHNIVEDPDRELDIMDEEEAAGDPIFKYNKMAKYWKDQGDDEMALIYMDIARLIKEKAVQQAIMAQLMPGGMPGEGGKKPSSISPQAQTGNIAAQPGQISEVGQ